MADLRPFRAIRYKDPASLPARVTPPYDVINSDQQRAYYEKDPQNFIRIDLGVQNESDDAENNRYTRARQTLFDWLADGVLGIDDAPAIYRHEQTFEDESGATITRKGFFSVIRLAEYEEGVVLPHERTLKGPKIDRLDLMKATECQLSPVFFLYDDPDSAVDSALREASEECVADLVTDDGIHHALWRVSSERAVAAMQAVLAPQPVLIADGHHRYETALAYRDHRRATSADHHADAPYEFTLGFFVNFRDPGLAVFGTHRAMHGLNDFDFERFKSSLEDASDFELEQAPEDADSLRRFLFECGERGPSFAVAAPGQKTFVARYCGDTGSDRFDAQTPAEVRALDVAILHEGLIDRQLGVDKTAQEAKTHIHYIKGFKDAVAAAATNDFQVVFLMNPTKVEQVDAVCRSGGKMPQKSTYFYPKVLSGLLINPA